MPAPVIEVRDLRKTYRDGWLGRKRIEALRGVTLQVQRGEIFGLLGPNGAGKTTLIKVLLGIVRKTSGDATLLDRAAGDRNSRRRVGYLPEGHRLPRHLTGNTALEYYGGLSGLSAGEVRRRREELLATVGLADWGNTGVKKYSKGMLQRLGLAQAMLHDPDLLVLDEPTDGVDPVGRAEIREVLKRLKSQGKTVFLNSHLLQEIELVCDRVAILVHGELRKIGNVSELTVGSTSEADFRLEGDPTTIRNALQGRTLTAWKVAGARQINAAVRISGQPELDACIDALRAAGISIQEASRRRLTLEEAFMQLVRDKPDAKAAEDLPVLELVE
jgi:ABC-2 type transport system ATP-binding protein